MTEQDEAVFFVSRPSHRLRQLETILHCPPALQVTSARPVDPDRIENRIASERGSSLWQAKRFIARNMLPVHFHRVSQVPGTATVLYLWGAFPLGGSRLPYVIELDNPYVLTYYNVQQFRLLRNLLRHMLLSDRCRKIVCISRACQETLSAELGNEVCNKSTVVYPYVAEPVQGLVRSEHPVPVFLFVANDFYLKGGREVLNVFQSINATQTQARLVMVTNLPPEYQRARSYSWLEVVTPGIKKTELFENYFSQADVLLHPTYQDSFGMVVLEAVAHGMPVIATDMYAIPELLGEVCPCLSPPLRFFDSEQRAVGHHWDSRFEARIRRSVFLDFEQQLEIQILELLDAAVRKRMHRELRERYRAYFTPSVRAQAFLDAVRGARNG